VLTRHVFRNSLLNLITLTGMSLPGLLGGSVIIEQIFSINGMGRLAYSSTLARDLPVIQDLALVGSVLTLLSYLAVDICYHLADPRVTYG
jgi:peptide/nickel transport system permease protein